MLDVKRFNTLCDDALEIRTKVFVDEQHFKDEFDAIDETCTTLVGYLGEKAVGCARVFYDEEEKRYKIGRLAVLKEYRGQKIGSFLLSKACEIVREQGGQEVYLHSQLQAVPFYERSGFQSFGEIEYEEYCPHIWMVKKLNG